MNVSRTRVIAAPPEAVWRIVAPVERLPDWLAGAERATPLGGPAEGVGRRHRLVRSLYGRAVETEQEVAAWEAGRLLDLRHVKETVEGREATAVGDFHTVLTLDPAGQGTRVRIAYRWRARLGIPWLQSLLLGGRVMGKELAESLRNIERLARSFP